MGFFKRLVGLCETRTPADAGCWSYEDGRIRLDLDRASELGERGSAIRLEGGALPERVLVVHGENGDLYAFKNRCSHGGRRLDPKSGEEIVQCCSVGQSTFSYNGERLGGSAKKSIESYPVERENNTLVIEVG